MGKPSFYFDLHNLDMLPPPNYQILPLSEENRRDFLTLIEQRNLLFDRSASVENYDQLCKQSDAPLGYLCYEENHACGFFTAVPVKEAGAGGRGLRLDRLFILHGVTDLQQALQQLLGQAYQTAKEQKCKRLEWVLPRSEQRLVAASDRIKAQRETLYRYQVEIES
ncbi:MAG: hypothetical protein J4A00_02895 [Gammaproteobacteria bacterium]|nr:hypothetical protein [Gammaproteobacteria bacterium]